MKNVFFIVLIFCANFIQAQNRSVGIIFNPTDSTYIVVDSLVQPNGQLTINQSIAIPANQVANFLFSSALSEQSRKRDLANMQELINSKFTFFSATIDTLMGVGSFNTLATQNLQSSLGGNWLIRFKDEGVDEKIDIQITGTAITEVGGIRAGMVTASGSEEITIAGFFAKSVVLTLKGNNEFFFKQGRREIRMRRR